ncbi:hypothetical protein [Oecophyllibacter saccharovorans]|uniref:Uncharacterized protein n=1 Tax=Oecophyllibacter saccharovorans TaxID=2558360 RepID=A0A506UKM7_9PROT|nr:hypothetical protein [Oecophyllibacter saccharovorans]QDH15058.1 hypothetical protein E3E11_03320 [Oecophyllibacter saccharovorans]TPW33897.1 hypothetical protein E3202_04710 [Oecophyllibacter saccharovorans]TPW35240.1 hypothetical protein E3203_07225 [Oecophyllibacter saccharovorans]
MTDSATSATDRQTLARREYEAVTDFLQKSEAYLDALQHSVLTHDFLPHRRSTPSAALIGDPSSWALMASAQSELERALKKEIDALKKAQADLARAAGL